MANLFAPSVVNFLGGATGDGSNTISIRPDIIADTSATGLGTAFATYSAVGGVRPLSRSRVRLAGGDGRSLGGGDGARATRRRQRDKRRGMPLVRSR